jgi:hypothetical protein
MSQKTIDRFTWASRVLQLLALLAGAAAGFQLIPAPGPQIAAFAATVFGIAAAWCEQYIPARATLPGVGKGAVAGVVLLMLSAFAVSACSPTDWKDASIRSADGLRAGGQLTASLMADASQKELAKCEGEHGAGAKACAPVAAKILKRLRIWQHGVRPAERVAVSALLSMYREIEAEVKARDNAASNKNGVMSSPGLMSILADIIKAIVEAVKAAGDKPEVIEARLVKYLEAKAHDKTDTLRAEIMARYPEVTK